ncbi:MAG: hypothetical protein QXP45_01255 [Thermoproteota archaeon]
MLIIDGVRYMLYEPKTEAEFENLVKEHMTEIFGRNSLYFDIKPDLRSKAGIGSKPDGIVVVFSNNPCVYIIEYELAAHPVYEHVVPQISRFNKAFEKRETRDKIVEAIYKDILNDPFKKLLVETKIKGELFKFLTDLFSSKPKLAVIVNEETEDLREAVEDLPFESNIIEFKTFEREKIGVGVHAHLFEPVLSKPSTPPSTQPKTWQEMLKWTSGSTRELTETLIDKIAAEFRGVKHKPLGRYYAFYKEKIGSSKTIFAVLMLRKDSIAIRIGVDPKTFNDEKGWVERKVYKGWFFKYGRRQEREFRIRDEEQLDYALKLIKQSYDTVS